MKRFFYLLVAMCAMAFVGCSDDDDDNGGGEDNSKSKIVMELFEDYTYYLNVSTLKLGEVIKVDWGDGNAEEYKADEEVEGDNYGYLSISHDYINDSKHVITIEGENIIGFNSAYSRISSLDVSKCANLATLICCECQELTSLNVLGCTALTYLDCSGTNLSSLDVTKCTALIDLICSDNNLSSLDVSKCTALTCLICSDNNLNVSALNKIYEDLPQVPESNNDDIGHISASDNPGYEASNKQIAINKGWKF